MRSKSLLTLIFCIAILCVFACKGKDSAEEPRTVASVAGTITSAASSYTDTDVNDNSPGSPLPVSNNTPATAQPIPVPATVGGYVNVAGEGPAGNSQSTGDEYDAYRVDLSAGHEIVLFIGEDPDVADLDLCLYDVTPFAFVDCSQGYSATEMLTVPADGSYYIVVEAYDQSDLDPTNVDASTYVLSVGQPLPTGLSRAGMIKSSDEFVPGELIVEMKSSSIQAMSKAGAAPSIASVASALGVAEARGGAPDRAMLFSIGNAGQRAALFQANGMQSIPSSKTPTKQRAYLQASEEERLRIDTIRAVKALNRRADVESVGLNYIRHPLAVPNDQFYPLQWHYPLINLPLAWDVSQGNGAVVAVIDTGIIDHPDLPARGSWVGGYDFIGSASRAGDGTGRDPDPTDEGDQPSGGSSFHGTHVAGTVAATSNNGTGVAGVAWGAQIMPLRVLGEGGGTTADIIEAVRYAAGLSNDSGQFPPQRAHVMNLSLGGGGFSQAAQNAYTAARAAGVVIIAAAGNDNSSQLFYPASYAGVISVSAVDTQKNRAPYSNFGTAIDVAAPGGDTGSDRDGNGQPDGVASTAGDDRSSGGGAPEFIYKYSNGTSMAAPHMAGVVALMYEEAPNMTPDQLDALLANGAITEDVSGDGPAVRNDTYGYGLIDARLAVDEASRLGGGAPTPDPTLRVNPSALNFGSVQSTLDITLSNAGGGTLNANAPTDDAAWLTFSPPSIGGDGLGTYTVVIDRSAVADGNYSATITITSDANTVTIPVLMTKGVSVVSNTGYQFLLLIDPDTGDTVEQLELSPSNGQYSYRFTNVTNGAYILIGGTDLDNDGYICHGGEACGAYPTLDQPQALDVSGVMTGLGFGTGFVVDIATQSASAGSVVPERGFRLLRPGGKGGKSLGARD